MDTLIEDLAALGVDGFERVRARVDATHFDQATELLTFLAATGGAGWCCTTDRAVPWSAEAPMPDGTLLQAELVDADGATSWSVRRRPAGWTVWTCTEGVGEDCLRQRESRRSTEPGRALRYAVYWQPSRDEASAEAASADDVSLGAWRPAFARFLGWEEAR